ncbi:hypothetical protein [Acetivibrio straminisolvens]|jgi:hypothetical protein|uniref:hypothetical protein n=1 Tax=Acetivibrio straminisolvens TaxID=253314 RepID=UPI002240BC6C|nr:hypothetical protein [Acetivibrio straminisolvens]
MDRNKLLKQTEKDLENFMKVYPTIMTFDGNAARKIKGELESRYNFQVKAIQREQAETVKRKEQEAIAELAAKKANETPEERIARLETALPKLGVEI